MYYSCVDNIFTCYHSKNGSRRLCGRDPLV